MGALGVAYHRSKYPSSADIALAYSRSAPGSHLRKYMARSYQVLADIDDDEIEDLGWTAEDVDEVVTKVPDLYKDFRALNRKSKGMESTEPGQDLVCAYHVHGPDEECGFKGLAFAGMC